MSIKLLSLFHAFGESDSKILGSVEIINSQLIGTGACLPDFVLTNAMLEHMVDTNDEWIVQRTGVRERRIAKNMHTWELALGAAQLKARRSRPIGRWMHDKKEAPTAAIQQ